MLHSCASNLIIMMMAPQGRNFIGMDGKPEKEKCHNSRPKKLKQSQFSVVNCGQAELNIGRRVSANVALSS